MSSEFARISHLAARFASLAPPRLYQAPTDSPSIAIGDDAAVLAHSDRPLVVTVDAAVEDVHFRRGWMTLGQIASRAVHAAVSDIAAMGASVKDASAGVLFALGIPRDFDDDDFASLIDGLALACRALGAPVLGGNLTASPSLQISTTVLARAIGAPVRRSGARPGDHVYITGPLGGCAIGLATLLAGRQSEPLLAPFVQRFITANARTDLAERVSGCASACIDVSDGLAADAAHLARASAVRVVLERERLPLLPSSEWAATALALNAHHCALSSGEEYELLFTSNAPALAFATQIGVVEDGEGVWLSDQGARDRLDQEPSLAGWDHFRE
jgi:thiamine-monophosphate kinase